MANLNITLAVNTTKKTCVQTGIPSVKETVNFVVTGLSGTSASNLRLFLTYNGALMASCETFSVGSGGYVGSTSLNDAALLDLFRNKKHKTERKLRVVIQDVTQSVDFLNDVITVMDNPYSTTYDDPEQVTPVS